MEETNEQKASKLLDEILKDEEVKQQLKQSFIDLVIFGEAKFECPRIVCNHIIDESDEAIEELLTNGTHRCGLCGAIMKKETLPE